MRYVEQVMGMPVSLALRGRHSHDAIGYAAWVEVITELRWVDLVFSTWRPDSAVSRLARGDLALADCPAEVAEVLALGEQAEKESGGAFSIHHRATFHGGTLDPTGVVKGWAAERASGHLEALAGTDYCLNAGGDLVCVTRDTGGTPWQIGIEDPADPSRLIASVPIFSGAMATSGGVHRGDHLVDARTGASPADIASVTVLAPSLTWADIDATAAYAMGASGASWLSSRGRGYLMVRTDGSSQAGVGPVCRPR
jgi:FAD:protein FMN transferase